jgi:hypothetical protein
MEGQGTTTTMAITAATNRIEGLHKKAGTSCPAAAKEGFVIGRNSSAIISNP